MRELSNLPPGVSDSDIPGNTAEDAAFDRLYDQIALSGLTAEEAKRRWDSQPDLLEACRSLMSHWLGSNVEKQLLDFIRDYPEGPAAKGYAAINKAEGR